MRKLYLHVGTQRTATTSIQEFLHCNAGALLQQGVLYPFGVRRHFDVFNRFFADRAPAPRIDAEGLHRLLEAEAAKHPGTVQSIILSDEDVSMRRDISALAGLRAFYDVQVVLFLRRQDLWLESWYLQNVKWQWDPALCHLTFSEFLDWRETFHWIDYAARVAHLENVFGRENVALQVFEAAQMPKGPVAAFCDLVGVKEPEKLKAPPRANPSLSPLVSEFMRQLPLDKASDHFRSQLESICIALDARLRKTPEEASPLLFYADQRADILARYASGNARVAESYFDRPGLFLDPPPAPDAPVARMALPQQAPELMERLVAPFLEEVIALRLQADKR